VLEQTGFFAGTGGFDVKVGGTTSLTGAALASEAEATKNRLQTGAIRTADLVNASNWFAKSWGVSASFSTSGKGGISPAFPGNEKGSSSGQTLSTVALGDVIITNAGLQNAKTGLTPEAALQALHRYNQAQNKQADQLPGALSEKLQNQADVSAAFGEASSATAKLVGDISSKLAQDASKTIAALEKKAKEEGNLSPEDLAALSEARREQDLWREGGMGRALLHTLSQGVLGGIGGGNLTAALEAGGGAFLASMLAPRLNDAIKESLKDASLDPKTSAVLASLLSEILTTALASSFGGIAGATAASVDMNNRQLHSYELKRIKDLSEGDEEKEKRLMEAACYLVKCADGVNANDPNLPVLTEIQNRGASHTAEIAQLSSQTHTTQVPAGCMPDGNGCWGSQNIEQNLFHYTGLEQLADFCSSGKTCTRVAGNVIVAASTAGVIIGGASCLKTVGAGCVLAAMSLDTAAAGYVMASTGEHATPLGEQILQSIGLTPLQASLLYGAVGLGATIVTQRTAATMARAGVEAQWVDNFGNLKWPPKNGFVGEAVDTTLPVGANFDRYGGKVVNGVFTDTGQFAGTIESSFAQRALTPSSQNLPLTTYKVEKELPNVLMGETAPWFGQAGGGTQYKLPHSIDYLLTNGYISKVK
jgi:filamentous hemagglutinin